MPLRFWRRDKTKDQVPDQRSVGQKRRLRRKRNKGEPVSGRKLAEDFLATLRPMPLPKRKGFKTPWLPKELREQFAADAQARAEHKRQRRCERRIKEALAGGWGIAAQERMMSRGNQDQRV